MGTKILNETLRLNRMFANNASLKNMCVNCTYNIDCNNQHLRSHNNPTGYRDANSEFWRPAFRIKQ